jgi:PKD domain/Secretion system C-terminal sorting domain
VDSSAPGGYTFQLHTTNTTTLQKIGQGNWDFVVLQEQSQLPSFPDDQVQSDVFPYAFELDDLIHASNPCAQSTFYMTWGRKNGDASNCANFPPLCTYNGMDSLLHLRYMMMADSTDALVSPVGAVWHFLRHNFPNLELYQADQSHPSALGSYAAACTFYAVFFQKSPMLITNNNGLAEADAQTIREAVDYIVYTDLLAWHVGEFDPHAQFQTELNGNSLTCTNLSTYADNYTWIFGDGTTSNEVNPVHIYTDFGLYNVQLTAERCGRTDVVISDVFYPYTSVQEATNTVLSALPNPAKDVVHLSCPNAMIGGHIQIISVLGEILQQEVCISERMDLHLNPLPTGVYFLRWKESPQHVIRIVRE